MRCAEAAVCKEDTLCTLRNGAIDGFSERIFLLRWLGNLAGQALLLLFQMEETRLSKVLTFLKLTQQIAKVEFEPRSLSPNSMFFP